MATVAITQLQNGTTADALSVDANFNALATQVNGNLDATNIASGAITDTQLSSAISPITGRKEMFSSFVVSGFTIATSVNLSTTIIGGTTYINGKRVVIANTPVTVAASKDTYIDISDTGAVTQVAVANNATSGMTMTLNSDGTNALRIAKLVSSATAIVQSLQSAFNTTPVAPNTGNWFGFDPLGNMVYNVNPTPVTLGYVHVLTDQNSITTQVDVTGLTQAVIVPAGRSIRCYWNLHVVNTTSGGIANIRFMEGATALRTKQIAAPNGANAFGFEDSFNLTPTAGSHTYKVVATAATGSISLPNSFSPGIFRIELV